MVMDAEREADEGPGEGESGVTAEGQSDVIQEIMSIIEFVARLGEYRKTQRKESYALVRHMKLLLPLIEEIRELDSPMSETSIACFRNLKKALLMAKKLLKICNEGSKLYLALEMESVVIKFYAVHDKLSQALDALAYDELGISDEVREQVELVCMQLRRAKRRTDTQDIELAMDMMVVFSKEEERNADSVILERLAKKLDLHSVEDLNNETIAARNLLRERVGQSLESTEQIIDLLNKFKQVAGMEITNVLDNPVRPRVLEKCQSLVIPHEFLCPITLEIMTDPVIVASGQTYERKTIEKWFDSNHRTCPKTRQTLTQFSVAPNYALKNLILQWCEKNNFKLPKKHNPASSEGSKTEQKEEIMALVEKLSSRNLKVQKATAKKIRMLSKENPENRILIAKCGGVSPLVHLLSYPDFKIQEHAVTALLNLSIDETNKRLLAEEEAIPPIIEILQNGSAEARENSAAALFSLSMLDENKIAIGSSNGIAPLVDLLKNGTIRGKKDAVTALFNLSLNHVNKAIAIDAGIVLPLLNVLEDKNLGMVDVALSIFLLLASHPQGRHKIGQLSFIKTLVEFIMGGTPKNKECATAVLLELGSNNSSFVLAALQYGVYEHLTELMTSGTNRAQRKASALLHLISKSEQL